MFLGQLVNDWDVACFPRVRGDVPPTSEKTTTAKEFSPRARGCSDVDIVAPMLDHVFPACVGMFRIFCGPPTLRIPFSPRARGCSRHGVADAAVGAVFPACAGMFPHG